MMLKIKYLINLTYILILLPLRLEKKKQQQPSINNLVKTTDYNIKINEIDN